jgi:sec-independent protein translocase protein TatB
MFDIGFSEFLVIGIVALVVIGPERLPKVARTAGHLLGRMQRYVNDVKSDINREMQLDELKKLQSQVVESARTLESTVRQEFDAARGTFAGIGQEAHSALAELQSPATQLETPGLERPDPAPAATVPGADATVAPVPETANAAAPRKIDQTTPVA